MPVFFSSKNARVSLSSPSPLAFDPFALAIIAPFLFLCYWEAVHTYLGSIATALYRPSAGSFPEQRLVIELTHGMTSDRDKIDTHFSWPRKHFFASTIVLQVIVCYRRVVGSISSNRHVPRWFHRTVFFGAPLAFLHVVKFFFVITFSSRRRNGLVSSLRHFHVLTSVVLLFVDRAAYTTAIS